MSLANSGASRRLIWFNELPLQVANSELLKCCGSMHWAKGVADKRPFNTIDELKETAANVWWSLDKSDWLEAFRSHPKIGEKKAQAKETREFERWSEHEQAGVDHSNLETIGRLSHLNGEYERKFGYIFIICATGKSADEILTVLPQRLQNEPEQEIVIAAEEQARITELRLAKLLNAESA